MKYYKQDIKMEDKKKKGPRVIGAIIVLLIILFFTIEYFIREAQEFSSTSVTNILLASLQLIVLLLFIILLFVLIRNLVKLYLERKRKVVGAHFKTRLVLFFTALSLIPTLLLFFFASDLISRNIEQWFKTPLNKIMDDTKSLADSLLMESEETTLHYARQLSKGIRKQKLLNSMIRRGLSFDIPDMGRVLVVTGKFLPQNYTQRINNITSYVQRYHQLKTQKNPVKTFYIITLSFITLLIIFAASWIGFHLARAITVPIEKLAQATKDVSKGNLDLKVDDPASGELGILIDSFNQMISNLKESHHNIAQKTSELEARKKYIETILSNIKTGVITLDAQGIITTINPSAREMLTLPGKNIIGKSYKDILSLSKYGEISKSIELGIQKKYRLSGKEININSGAQDTALALSLSPLRQSNNKFSGLIVVLDNLTQLIKAQKIAAWKEVAQRVAHEIKNPLTPIQLSAERIIKHLKKKKEKPDEIIDDGANTIVQEARTIKALVDEFSNFARMPIVHMQSTDIHEIIEQAVSLFKGLFKDIEFEVLYSFRVPSPIQTDPEQMKRVFINILDNAIHAMNKKGRIKIQTSFVKKEQRVKIEIADSGHGISLKDKDKLFLPHFSTKKKGTGLGLAIVNQVINEHNGSINVENNHPHGTKFVIQIPA